ncbi:MAG: hypothetical protein NTX61_15585 [Bacteroidetes bacterium]|nr:hypothetical protein [Bacteroidota bacterium]
MNPKKKKILLFGIVAVILLIIILIVVRYIPFSKLLRAPSTPEVEFVNPQLIQVQAPNSLSYNFEVDPKTGNENGLYKGIAHSGQYSVKAFGNNAYSIAIERTARQVGPENLKSVALSAWLYIFSNNNDADGVFVFSVSNSLGVSVCWKGLYAKGKDLPRGKWFKISGLFDLANTKFEPDYKIQVYFWNRSHTDILIDDYYVVFGGTKERRGDSTFVDMTKGQPFKPKFNFPPFPVNYFEKEEINNHNSDCIIWDDKMKEGGIGPQDKVVVGRFTGAGNMDDILVITSAGKASLYTFCTEKSEFRKVELTLPPDLGDAFQVEQAMKGSFTGSGNDQLLLIGKYYLLLGSFDRIGNSCSSSSGIKSTFHIIGKAEIRQLTGSADVHGTLFKTTDLDGNKITELLAITKEGIWKVFRFTGGQKGNWFLLAGGEKDIKEWISSGSDLGITPGRFLIKYYQDLLLTVFKDPSTGKFQYTLLRFDPVTHKFLYCFPEKQNFLGKTIGLDTLKPGDQFFMGKYGSSDETAIYRYNRDWRFDLKKIRFNDSTYEITASIDFRGFDLDRNPKYYEILKVYNGFLVKPNLSSLLIIARNKNTNLPSLPNTFQIYSSRKP